MFAQKYHGDCTIIPRFRVAESMGLRAIVNPTVEDMHAYLDGGARAVWPHLRRIETMLSVEVVAGSQWEPVGATSRWWQGE